MNTKNSELYSKAVQIINNKRVNAISREKNGQKPYSIDYKLATKILRDKSFEGAEIKLELKKDTNLEYDKVRLDYTHINTKKYQILRIYS